MDLDIHQLRVFIEVVRFGSFSKAGEKLNLSAESNDLRTKIQE